MGFLDEIKKLTQPYDDDDYFEGANEDFKAPTVAPVSKAQQQFEQTFADEPVEASEPLPRKGVKAPAEGSIFGNLGKTAQNPNPKPQKPRKERMVNFSGNETQVILFSPKTFDEAGELMNHLIQNRSVLLTLEGQPTETARRLLDFLSGIAFALQGKITPVSAKTYFVTPQNVDLLGSSAEQPESDGQYF